MKNIVQNIRKIKTLTICLINRWKVVFNLHNKSLKWFELFENKTVLNILDIVLRGSYQNNEP